MQVMTSSEVEDVAAGVTWQQISVGLAMLSLGVGIAATGGLGGLAIGAIVGAGYATDLALAGAALGLAAGGGAVIGGGIVD